MTFTEMREKMTEHFNEMIAGADLLFEVGIDKDEFWNLYLESFPAGKNDIYRVRREFECSCCRQFIRAMGNVVTIKDNKVTTIWDFRTDDDVFQPMLNAMDDYIKTHAVTDVYVSKIKKIGTKRNYEIRDGQTYAWDHFYLELPDRFVDKSRKSEGDIKGTYRDTRNVFKRSLEEITEDSILTILELISSNTLYRGEEWKTPLTEFLKYKREYEQLTDESEKDNYAWENSNKAGIAIGRIRNHSIGTLLVNLSEDMDLDLAVRKYEQIVAPSNYKRPKEIYTKKMLEDAQKTITELGYLDSLGRRFAKLDDITVNNILFSNKDAAKAISGANDIFSEMKKEAVSNPKKFSRVEEVSIEKFVSDILPTTKELELYLENRHASNMVSLIAPENKDAKTMFKWNNNFSWTYAGNMTDSMKERVREAGGKVDGDLRFSIQWNDGKDWDQNDLDAHCLEPAGYEIFYGNKRRYSPNRGMLDVDIIYPDRGKAAVENIVYVDRNYMMEGSYVFGVHCYSDLGGKSGFRAEIEFDGQIYEFDYNKPLRRDDMIVVAYVTLKNGKFTIEEKLKSNMSSKDIWGVKTNQFVPVSVAMYSPNYWDEQDGIGHRHYFFMLKNCVNPEEPNGFYNEFLKNDLMEHKRVFAALGSKMKVEAAADQLSGVGFSSTKRDEVVVKVKGNTERVIKVKF